SRGNRFPHARVRDRRWIDAAPALFHVRKLVSQRRYPLGRQRVGERFQERVPHPRARAVRQNIEAEGAFGPAQDHFSFSASFASAPWRSGFISRTGASGSSRSFFIRAGALFSVNFLGSSLPFTSLQRSGMDTVPPGTGRALNAPAMVFPCP